MKKWLFIGMMGFVFSVGASSAFASVISQNLVISGTTFTDPSGPNGVTGYNGNGADNASALFWTYSSNGSSALPYNTVGDGITLYVIGFSGYSGYHSLDYGTWKASGFPYVPCSDGHNDNNVNYVCVYKWPNGSLNFTAYVPPPASHPSLAVTIASSSALFASTVGFTYASLVSWSGGRLLLILGGGLGLVYALIGWIIAIIIITVIVRLIYHSLRWLHILR